MNCVRWVPGPAESDETAASIGQICAAGWRSMHSDDYGYIFQFLFGFHDLWRDDFPQMKQLSEMASDSEFAPLLVDHFRRALLDAFSTTINAELAANDLVGTGWWPEVINSWPLHVIERLLPILNEIGRPDDPITNIDFDDWLIRMDCLDTLLIAGLLPLSTSTRWLQCLENMAKTAQPKDFTAYSDGVYRLPFYIELQQIKAQHLARRYIKETPLALEEGSDIHINVIQQLVLGYCGFVDSGKIPHACAMELVPTCMWQMPTIPFPQPYHGQHPTETEIEKWHKVIAESGYQFLS